MTALCELLNVPGRPGVALLLAAGDRARASARSTWPGRSAPTLTARSSKAGWPRRPSARCSTSGCCSTRREAELVKLTIYVVDYRPEKFQELGAGLMAARAQREFPQVPVTLLGVQSLFEPEQLVEIEGRRRRLTAMNGRACPCRSGRRSTDPDDWHAFEELIGDEVAARGWTRRPRGRAGPTTATSSSGSSTSRASAGRSSARCGRRSSASTSPRSPRPRRAPRSATSRASRTPTRRARR